MNWPIILAVMAAGLCIMFGDEQMRLWGAAVYGAMAVVALALIVGQLDTIITLLGG